MSFGTKSTDLLSEAELFHSQSIKSNKNTFQNYALFVFGLGELFFFVLYNTILDHFEKEIAKSIRSNVKSFSFDEKEKTMKHLMIMKS